MHNDIRKKFLKIMEEKVLYNRNNDKYKYSYSHIDEAIYDFVRDNIPFNFDILKEKASKRFGKNIPETRVRPHIMNRESNAINNWLKKEHLEINLRNKILIVRDMNSGKEVTL